MRASRSRRAFAAFGILVGVVASLASGCAHAAAPTFAPYEAIATGSWPSAVAIADLDGDGRNDIVLATRFYFDPANDYKLFVFFQNPDGTLSPPLKLDGGNGNSVAIGDLDGDGRPDIAIADYNNGLVILYNTTPPRATIVPPVEFPMLSRTNIVALVVILVALGPPILGRRGMRQRPR